MSLIFIYEVTSNDIDISELFTLKRKCIRGDSSPHPFDEAYFSGMDYSSILSWRYSII